MRKIVQFTETFKPEGEFIILMHSMKNENKELLAKVNLL